MAGKEDIVFFSNAETAVEPSSHEVILQTLDQWRTIRKQDGSAAPAYFGESNFAGTEEEWNGVPVIFTNKRHPSVPFSKDPAKALKSCNGRIVGTFKEATLDKTGTTKFRGIVDYSDEDVEKLHGEGKLALSSGFYSKYDKSGKLVGKVIPDHIIVFQPTESFRPQDMGAMFLNATPRGDLRGLFEGFVSAFRDALGMEKIDNAMGGNESFTEISDKVRAAVRDAEGITGETTNLYVYVQEVYPDYVVYSREASGAMVGTLIKRSWLLDPATGSVILGDAVEVQKIVSYEPIESVMNAAQAGTDGGETMTASNQTTTQQNDLTAAIGDKDRQIKEWQEKYSLLEQANADYKAKLEGFEQSEQARKKTERDQAWENIKKTALLPGQTHKPEDETKLREQWENDPSGFFMNAVINRPRAPERGLEGSEFVSNASETTDADKEIDTAVEELKRLRRR